MKTFKNDSAFPLEHGPGHESEFGLTKREFFTAQALIGILGGDYYENFDQVECQWAAVTAVNLADEVIAALNDGIPKTEGGQHETAQTDKS